MIPQREMNKSTREQTGSMYGGYEGEQEYARQHDSDALRANAKRGT